MSNIERLAHSFIQLNEQLNNIFACLGRQNFLLPGLTLNFIGPFPIVSLACLCIIGLYLNQQILAIEKVDLIFSKFRSLI
jgi:hypothetical protein